MRLAFLYAIMAGIATIANIGAQDLFLRIYDDIQAVAISILIGTGVGLIVKYLLDKRYIFRFQAKNAAHDVRIFTLYTLMGILTTLIFWGVELGFDYFFGTRHMRYVGGVIGLTIGYFVKYQLDKRFVFVPGASYESHAKTSS